MLTTIEKCWSSHNSQHCQAVPAPHKPLNLSSSNNSSSSMLTTIKKC
jgi:hypothetical protein